MKVKHKSNPIGKCCKNEPKYSAEVDNSPLDSFCILLCHIHAFDPVFTKNTIKIEKLEAQ